MYSEENVDDPTELDYYVTLDIDDVVRPESSTAPSCRTFFLRVSYIQKSSWDTLCLGHFLRQVASYLHKEGVER